MERVVSGESGFFLSETALEASYEVYFNYKFKNYSDIFVLINRKGYWDYKIFFPDGIKNKLNGRKMKIISDRYLEKCSRRELKRLVQGKIVSIYDDSLTNGSNLFYYYLLCKAAGAEEIIPMVYALNSAFPSENAKVLMRRETTRICDEEFWGRYSKDGLIDEFISKIKFRVLLDNCETERMSRWQTVLFQQNVSPLVMDLPIINRMRGNNSKKILLSWEQLDRLKQSANDRWKYIENIGGGLKEPIVASYFQFEDTLLEWVFSNLFYNYVVKCKYEKCKENENYVRVVFTPFAIARSTTFESILECFCLLYYGTAYAKEIFGEVSKEEFIGKKMEEDDNVCNALFRAVIYRISSYIGMKFQKYVNDVLGMDVEYDWKIMEDNFDSVFIGTHREWCQSFDEDAFETQLLQYCDDIRIQPIAEERVVNADKVKATQEKVNNHIRMRLIEKKKAINCPLEERIYTFEAIEYELENRFSFRDDRERKTMITNACLLFLETNSFSNYILVNSKEHILYRGFRYGENSEILLHENFWFFYAYLYAYYDNAMGKLKDGYQSFTQQLEDFFCKRGYMGNWITEDGFCFLRDYFGKFETEEELTEEIARRRYLVENNENGVEDSVQAGFIREAACIVEQWGKA